MRKDKMNRRRRQERRKTKEEIKEQKEYWRLERQATVWNCRR
jgi:hypothetical protein